MLQDRRRGRRCVLRHRLPYRCRRLRPSLWRISLPLLWRHPRPHRRSPDPCDLGRRRGGNGGGCVGGSRKDGFCGGKEGGGEGGVFEVSEVVLLYVMVKVVLL